MKLSAILSLVLMGTVTLSSPCGAQSSGSSDQLFDKMGQAGMTFLKIGPVARAAGMGDAFSATSSGSESAFYNPAGLGFTRGRFDAAISYVSWIADIGVSSGAVGIPIGSKTSPLMVAAISYVTMDYGTIHGTVINTDAHDAWQDVGDLEPSEFLLGVSVARRFTDRFSIGITAKFVNQSLPWYNTGGVVALGTDPIIAEETTSVKTIAFDGGTIYRTGFGSSVISMSIRNFARTQTYEVHGFRLPITFQIGVATDVFDLTPALQQSGHSLVIAFDGIHPADHPEKGAIGSEYSYQDLLFLRGGYSINYDSRKWSFGLGFKYTIFGFTSWLDYAHIDLGSSFGTADFVTMKFSM